MRYDAQEHLDAYREDGRFPKIHDDLFRLFEETTNEEDPPRVCDLACSTGLLGQRIQREMPATFVMGIEADEGVIARAKAAGVAIPIVRARIEKGTLDVLEEILESYEVDTVVARRCLPEILGEGAWADWLTNALRRVGVATVYVEGRQVSARTTHPLGSIEDELRVLGGRVLVRRKSCAKVRL